MKNTLLIQTLLLAGTLMVTDCQKVNDKNSGLLGKWQGAEWLIDKSLPRPGTVQVSFEFKNDGTYSTQFGEQKQVGTWRTDKKALYMKEESKDEIETEFGLQKTPEIHTYDIVQAFAKGEITEGFSLLNKYAPDKVTELREFYDKAKKELAADAIHSEKDLYRILSGMTAISLTDKDILKPSSMELIIMQKAIKIFKLEKQ